MIRETPKPAPAKTGPWMDPSRWATKPEEQRYLVEWPDGKGCIPADTVGILAAAGGYGKTWLAMDLAVAVATGGFWMDPWPPRDKPAQAEPNIGFNATRGKVVLILAETPEMSVLRRWYQVLLDRRLIHDGMADQEIRENVRICCEPAESAVMVEDDSETLTPWGAMMDKAIRDFAPSLLVIDPMVIVAPADVETDNTTAARFIRRIGKVGRTPGSPMVTLLTHHVSQGTGDRSGRDGNAVRGVTALVNQSKWVGQIGPALDPLKATGKGDTGKGDDVMPLQRRFARFSVEKSNDAAYGSVVDLYRDDLGRLAVCRKAEANNLRDLRKKKDGEPPASGTPTPEQIAKVLQ